MGFHLSKQKTATILKRSLKFKRSMFEKIFENRLSKLLSFLIPFTIESVNILPCIALFVSNDSSVAPPKVCLTSSLLLMHRFGLISRKILRDWRLQGVGWRVNETRLALRDLFRAPFPRDKSSKRCNVKNLNNGFYIRFINPTYCRS